MLADLQGYVKLVASKKVTSAVSLVALVLAIYNGVRPPSKPAVLPIWLWLAVAAASLIVAQFLVWRDVWRETRERLVEGPHLAQLRTIAARLRDRIDGGASAIYTDGQSGAAILRDMFTAHFPSEVARVSAADAAHKRVAAANEALLAFIRDSGFERFPKDEWYWMSVVQCCVYARATLLEAGELAEGALQHTPGGELVWNQQVLRFDAADQDERRVRDWVRDVFGSDAANEYRNATAQAGEARVGAVAALEPIIHHAPIRVATDCLICFRKC